MLALQMSGTFFVLAKISGTKSWGKTGFLQVEASLDYHEPRVSGCRGSNTLRGGLLLLSRRRLFYG